MRIVQVELTVSDVSEATSFYRDVLALPVSGASAPLVQIGDSELVLRQGSCDPARADHLALLIAADDFDRAKQWVAERVTLLERDGVSEIALAAPWSSRSVYFCGPDGILLELIARDHAPHDGEGGTGLGALGISEIGVTVTPAIHLSDALDAADLLAERFGLPRFGRSFADFAPVGDHDGLLILVGPDRPWLLVGTLPALTPLRVVVAAETETAQVLAVGRSRVSTAPGP